MNSIFQPLLRESDSKGLRLFLPAQAKWFVTTLGLTVAGFALYAIWSVTWCGSLESGLAYLGGERLLIETKSKSFGTVSQGVNPTIRLRVVNHTGRPLRVIGAKVSCSCLSHGYLPKTISPGEIGTLELKVLTARRSGTIKENIRWYTDSKEMPQIPLVVLGTVEGPKT